MTAHTTAIDIDVASRIRNRVAELVGPQQFKIWFRNSTQFTSTDCFLKVGVPNLFIGGWIEDHFSEQIAQAATEVLGPGARISYAIDPVLFRNVRKNQLNSQAAFIEKHAERALRDHRGNPADRSVARQRVIRGRLETFVVGPSNRLAYSVARAVVENPAANIGPLFFHSGCGLGKTHLLQGIASALSESAPRTQWVYVSGEEFTNQFLYALRNQQLDAFRHRFRDIDILLIDDVQFIANKKATQEEFLHTLNAIDAAGKRVILASDAHPKMIGDLSEPLVNRLLAGMIVRIDRPDIDTRCEILRRRAAHLQHAIPEPVIRYVADKVTANVRELEGCLLKLIAFASMSKIPITIELARQALEDHLTQTGKIVTVSDIELSVSTYFALTPADLHTSRKSRTIALARNVAMCLARKHTDLSFPEIARLMGNKNHTTVLLACRRMNLLLSQNAEVLWQSAAGPQSRPLETIIKSLEEQMHIEPGAASVQNPQPRTSAVSHKSLPTQNLQPDSPLIPYPPRLPISQGAMLPG